MSRAIRSLCSCDIQKTWFSANKRPGGITTDEYGWGEVLLLKTERNNLSFFKKRRHQRSETRRDSLISSLRGIEAETRWGGDWHPETRGTHSPCGEREPVFHRESYQEEDGWVGRYTGKLWNQNDSFLSTRNDQSADRIINHIFPFTHMTKKKKTKKKK